MMAPTTEIAAFNSQLEADLVVAVLAEAGIDAFVLADNLGGTFPMMHMVTGGYRIMVPTAVADDAREIVVGGDAGSPTPVPRRSALFRVLSRLSPGQAVAAMALLIASIATTIYAVTQGTL